MYFIKYYYTIFQILLKHLFLSQDFLLFFFFIDWFLVQNDSINYIIFKD